MAKKEEKKQPETTEELIPEETAEAPQEAPKAAETPETNPFEEKYNAGSSSTNLEIASYEKVLKELTETQKLHLANFILSPII